MKAVIDRFEGEFAVLIVGDEEKHMNVLRTLLPKNVDEGQWLNLDIFGGEVKNITINDQETANAKKRISDKLAALRRGDQLK